MKTKIGRHFTFEAAHQLVGEQYGQCQNVHGHRYELTVEVEGEINEHGWICDFAELDMMVSGEVLKKYDHQSLNFFYEVPTVENIARGIFIQLDKAISGKEYKITKVTLYETHDSYAEITD